MIDNDKELDLGSQCIKSTPFTHLPHIPNKSHRVGHPAGDARGAKAETVVANLPRGVGPEGTVTRVFVVAGARRPEAEVELVVALAVAAPPRRAPAGRHELAAVASAVSVPAVAVVHRPHLESVRGSAMVDLHEICTWMI